MSDLLPANATAQERAISDAIERAGSVPVLVREVWNPDTCPSNLLAWLAWAFSVDNWDPAWTDAQKRQVIKASVDVHRYKGTIGAVQEALAALFVGARVQEWFNQIPAGDPYTFRVQLEAYQTGFDQADLQTLLTVIENTKNLRSHLDQIDPIVRAGAAPLVAVAAGVGSEINVTNYIFATVVCNGTTICI